MIRAALVCLCGCWLMGAELTVSPERIAFDARSEQVPDVTVQLGTVGKILGVNAEWVDSFAEAAGPGVDVGKPVVPVIIVLPSKPVVPGGTLAMVVGLSPAAAASRIRGWGAATELIRLRTDEVGKPTYAVPVLIRYHARPVVSPEVPTGNQHDGGWEVAFSLNTGDASERISGIELNQATQPPADDSDMPLIVPATMQRTPDGSCRMSVIKATSGWLVADLLIDYDQPAPMRKRLSLRCHLGALPVLEPGRVRAEPPSLPSGPRRVRIQ